MQSRPALALVVVVHACCIFALAKLIDTHRIALREPLIVELLETPKPEIERPRPKIKPPEPKVEEPSPPQEKPPEPKVEEPPPPEQPVLKPDVPPRPLPQVDLPLPVPIAQVPPEPEPIQQQVMVEAPRVAPTHRVPHDPLPEPMPKRISDPAPQPAVQRAIAPAIEPPSRPPHVTEDRRERPLPPMRVAQVPSVPEMPRRQDPILKVERDVPDARPVALTPREPPRRAVPEKPPTLSAVTAPAEKISPEPPAPVTTASEARPVSLAPREPTRRVVPDKPVAVATVSAPVEQASAEPQPQVSILPEPPAGASAEVLDEIALGAEMLRANYLRNPKPLYPAISRRLKEQGTVLLRVLITVAGQPTEVIIKASSGYPRLDNAAKLAVVGWKFVPATRDEKPVEAWVIVPVKFSLSN